MAAAEAIVVGAGPAGLAAAQRLRSGGLKPVILEKSGDVGAAWRRHYDRLHLHTPRRHSGLAASGKRARQVSHRSRAIDQLRCRVAKLASMMNALGHDGRA